MNNKLLWGGLATATVLGLVWWLKPRAGTSMEVIPGDQDALPPVFNPGAANPEPGEEYVEYTEEPEQSNPYSPGGMSTPVVGILNPLWLS